MPENLKGAERIRTSMRLRCENHLPAPTADRTDHSVDSFEKPASRLFGERSFSRPKRSSSSKCARRSNRTADVADLIMLVNDITYIDAETLERCLDECE